MKRFTKTTIILSVFIFAAVILRLAYLWQFSASPLFNIPVGPDVEEYDNWAREILAWGINFRKLHIHAPLYPALLAALYSIFSFKMLWIRLFQTLLVFGGFGLLAWGIRRFVAPKRRVLTWIFLFFAAFYPLLLFYSSELISESLLLPLLCLSITLLYWSENQLAAGNYRKGALLISAGGLCAGLAAITHPGSLLFIAAEMLLLLLLACRRGATKKISARLLIPFLFGVMALLVIAPVCVRNSMLGKRFIFIQKNSGFNFYLGNNYNATGTCYIRPGKSWNRIHKWANAGAAQRGITKDQFFLYMSLRFIRANPLEEFKLLVKKAFYVWNFRELTAGADSAPLRYFTGAARSGKYLFMLLGSLSICGIILVLRRRERIFQYRHFLILLASCWAAQIITVTSGRYRLAMYPAFFIFAAFALDYLRQHRKNHKQLLKCGLAVLFGVLIVTLPSPPVNPLQEQAEADSLLGEAYFKQGKYQQAAKHFQACLRFDPINARAYNLLGIITEASSPGNAAGYYRLAIKSAPDEAEGYLNLAIQYSSKGERKQAEKYFAEALRRGPDKADVLYNYACFLQKYGQLTLAAKYLEKCLLQAPWHDKALNILGVIHIQNKQPGLALKYLRSARQLAPAKTGVMLNLAVALYQNGQSGDAVNMLKKIIAIEPNSKSAGFLLNEWQKK